MKTFVLAILTATSINALAETCPGVVEDFDALENAKEFTVSGFYTREKIDDLIKDREEGLNRRIAACEKTTGQKVDLSELDKKRKSEKAATAAKSANDRAESASKVVDKAEKEDAQTATNVEAKAWIQPVDATSWLNRSAGVS